MQPTKQVDLIDLQPDHLLQAHRLSQQESWPHRAEDWALMLRISQGFAAISDGKLVGTGMFTPFGLDVGTCNMVIVDPSVRGTGLGRRLMGATLDAAGDRECRLVATEAGRPLYEKLGFTSAGMVNQYQGLAGLMPHPDGVDTATPQDLDEINAMDTAATGMDRRGLLSLLLSEERVMVLRNGDELRGYVAVRPFGRGTVIGPLVAVEDASARILTQAALATCAGTFTRIDLTESGMVLWDLVDRSGLASVDEIVAMVRAGSSATPHTGVERPYALASQALG